jgi:hypothetical protein
MAYHTTPESLPSEWIASYKLPSCEGMYETWIVIRPSNSTYHPFVVHKGWWNDDSKEWAYAYGVYCVTLEEAQAKFKERCK